MFRIDLRAFALFRTLTGILLAYDAIDKIVRFRAFFSDFGVLPRAMFVQNAEWSTFHSLFLASDHPVFTIGLFLAQAACGLMMVAGLRPRLAALIGWIIFVSGNVRNPMIVYGADQIMRSVLLIAALCPLDKASFSRREGFVSVPGATLIIQVIIMYFLTGFFKTGPEWVQDYSATHYTLRLNTYSSAFGRYLLDYPGLLKVLTIAVYWLEVAGIWLLLVPARIWWLRTAVILALWGFHFGTAVTMNVGFFPFISIAVTAALLPAGLFDRLQGLPAAEVAKDLTQRAPANATGSVFLVFLLVWNGVFLAGKNPLQVPGLNDLGRHTFLWQHWNMFAPSPNKATGWIVVPGVLETGEAVDVLNLAKGVPSEAMPEDLNAHLGGARWVRFFTYLIFEPIPEQHLYYGKYLCRRWHVAFPETKLKRFEIKSFLGVSNKDLGVDPPVSRTVWTHECYR